KLVRGVLRRVHRRIENSPLCFDFVWPWSGCQFGIADEPGRSVSGHIEFRHHPNAAIARVRNQFPDLIPRVVVAAGAHLVQFWEFLALDAESLVLAEVEVENVHLHGFHAVERALYDFYRHPVTAGIQQESAPREAGSVFDVDCWSGKSLGTRGD